MLVVAAVPEHADGTRARTICELRDLRRAAAAADVTSSRKGGAFVANDAFGQVYVRRRLLGTVPRRAPTARRTIASRAGSPLVMKLARHAAVEGVEHLPRWQRESFMFAPGEYVHESFRTEFFDGFCGQCHGSISGRPLDVAMRPDVLSGASLTSALGSSATDLFIQPSQRGAPVGPPFSP